MFSEPKHTDSSVNKDRIVIRQIQCSEADYLLDASTRYMENLYPAESNHLLEVEELLQGTGSPCSVLKHPIDGQLHRIEFA